VVERAERLVRGFRTALVASNEAIEQAETAARKRRDELAEKQLEKTYQSRKGGLMTAQAGREMWDDWEVKEQSASQRRAAKLAKEAEEEEVEQARVAAEATKQGRRRDAMALIKFYDKLDDEERENRDY
jgi:hypothetical protein